MFNGLIYKKKSNRLKIRKILLKEQLGFCAYSERFISQIDKVDIEHFDPRLKLSDSDNYLNWYAVLAWMNEHKPKKIEPYLGMFHRKQINFTLFFLIFA